MSSIEKKKTAIKKSDIDFYKMSGVFALACVFVILILRMYNTITLRHSTGKNLTYNIYELCRNPIFLVAGGLLFVGAAAWFVHDLVKKTDASMKLFTGYEAICIMLYLASFALTFGVEINSTRHMFFLAFTIAAACLYYISKIFHVDFIFYTVMNGIFVLSLYASSQIVTPVFLAIKAVLVVIAVAVCCYFRKKYGASAKTEKHTNKRQKTSYLFFPVWISLVLWALFMFWRAFTINTPLFITTNFMLMVMLVQYLVVGIVYTIRLIRE